MTGQWLEITDLTGLHSGANPISGEFSFGASDFSTMDPTGFNQFGELQLPAILQHA